MSIGGSFKGIICLQQTPNVIESSFRTVNKMRKASKVSKGVLSVALIR